MYMKIFIYYLELNVKIMNIFNLFIIKFKKNQKLCIYFKLSNHFNLLRNNY